MLGVELLAYLDIKLAFSPSGHGLMTLIVSFLVISKVNLTYERYMMARHAIGHGLAALRELNQAVLFYTQHISPNDNDNKAASEWRRVVCTVYYPELSHLRSVHNATRDADYEHMFGSNSYSFFYCLNSDSI